MSSRAPTSGTRETTAGPLPFENSLEQMLAGLAYIDLRIRYAVARARVQGLDPNDEFRGLYISEAQVDSLLGSELGHSFWSRPNGQHPELVEWPGVLVEARRQWQARVDATVESGQSLLLDRLARKFELSPVEVDILLIALASEIDPRYERLFAYLQDDVTKKRPSVDLVLNLLTDAFEEKLRLRALLTDEGRLLRSRLLIRFADGGVREPTLLGQQLRPAARVVEHLLGLAGVDSQLAGSAKLDYPTERGTSPLLPDEITTRLLEALQANLESARYPIFTFQGGYGVGKQAAARHVAHFMGQPLLSLDLVELAQLEIGLNEGVRLALRDGRLLDATLYLGGWDTVVEDGRAPADLFRQLLEYPGVVILAGQASWQPAGEQRARRVLRVPFNTTDYEHRLQVWQHHLEDGELPLDQLANQFRFTPGQIEDVIATAHDLARWHQRPVNGEDLFVASRAHSNQKLGDLATKISPRYHWEDIVLPGDTIAQLREMVNMVRQRPMVYGQWGFENKLALGKGLSALFAGESGTGKTMAADIMAGELNQDLYKIDLSMLVSKYIGETEKNLNRVFTEAETSNAILFFDEADAIFGKRSEVKDSHDRYANIEISYLLQRMESYDGVVILATNLRGNLDEAFTRRLHFIVEFPFPEVADREIIWQVNFPKETPLDQDVDFHLLAKRFRLAGGNIRNIIMAAAFLAAEESRPVAMRHLLHGAKREYQKLGRLIDEGLFLPEMPE
ncbi:MAG: AAA family ATPase [Candidatus Promineifilaceae bacterium]